MTQIERWRAEAKSTAWIVGAFTCFVIVVTVLVVIH